MACGFIDPARFARAVESAGLAYRCMPTLDRQHIFEFLRLGGLGGLKSAIETLVELLSEAPRPVTRYQAERAAYAYGTDVNLKRFAAWVREFSTRAQVYHTLPSRILDHSQPIGQIVKQVMEDVTSAVRERPATSAA